MRAQQRQDQLGKNPIRERLRELFSELKTYTDEKKDKLGEIEAINKRLQEVNRELEKQRKNVHPIYNEEAKLEKGIKELQQSLQTNSWSRADEARIVKEIAQVENSRPFFSQIEKLRGQAKALKEEREAVKQTLNGPNKIIASLKQRISEQKGEETKFDSSKKLQ